MTFITVTYRTPQGVVGSLPVELGDTYTTAEEFVSEFLDDHEDYTVIGIKEEQA